MYLFLVTFFACTGTPIVLLHSTDLQVLTNLAPVAKSLMEKAGFKVDMQSMDWQTVVARRAKPDPVSAGGWHAMLTSWVSADILNPVMIGFMNASCDKAPFGWPCSETIEKLRDQFSKETDPAKQKAIAEQVQLEAIKAVTHVPLGQWYPELDDCFLVAVTEKRTKQEIDALARTLSPKQHPAATEPVYAK